MYRWVFWALWLMAVGAWFLFSGSERRVRFGSEGARQVTFNLSPGGARSFELSGVPMSIAVPMGPEESMSIGSFVIQSEDGRWDWDPALREGTVERAWLTDFNRDGIEDAVIVCRSAGSGSFARLSALVSTESGWDLIGLSEMSPEQRDGYMGHGTVWARDGILEMVFPTYRDEGVRIDHQWRPEDLKVGALPIKRSADSHATPSGLNRRLVYNWSAHAWESSR